MPQKPKKVEKLSNIKNVLTIIHFYKVYVCENWMKGLCLHEAEECFYSHCAAPERRKLTFDPATDCFNYTSKRCLYWKSRLRCPDGMQCKYSHGALEQCFHPLVFRIKLCPQGDMCTRQFCTYAHSEDQIQETRALTSQPNLKLLLPKKPNEPKTKNPNVESFTVTTTATMTVGTMDAKKVSSSSLTKQEQDFYIAHYKTKKCEDFYTIRQCTCNGFNYHSQMERRRSPLLLHYKSSPCPHVRPKIICQSSDNPTESKKEQHVWLNPFKNSCKKTQQIQTCDIWMCDCCHTRNELMYHPFLYKTIACERFQNFGTCLYGKDCAHYHDPQEKRITGSHGTSFQKHNFQNPFQLNLVD